MSEHHKCQLVEENADEISKESIDTYGIGSVSSGYSGSRSLTRGDKSF
jgi:hypothetical protein